MTEIANSIKASLLPDTSTEVTRQRWLTLLDLSYSTRQVTQQEIEMGVRALVIPASLTKDAGKDLLEVEVRKATSQIPGMARSERLALEQFGDFALTLPAEYHGWMGAWGKDVAAGKTKVAVFVDLAYLEAALLARLWDSGVLVEFGSPMAFFRRGALTDYADIHEAVGSMVAEGRSLGDEADRLAPEVLNRLQLYANVYLQLSSLYTQAAWSIDQDNFVIKTPGPYPFLSLQYWQLRDGQSSSEKILRRWRHQIENLLGRAPSHPNSDFPKSFAA